MKRLLKSHRCYTSSTSLRSIFGRREFREFREFRPNRDERGDERGDELGEEAYRVSTNSAVGGSEK